MPDGWAAARGSDAAIDTLHLTRAVALAWAKVVADFASDARLHPTDVQAIVCLLDAARDGVDATPGWLGQQLGMQSPAVTALVDRLERMKLVDRVRDADDRRRVRLQVTDAAVRLGWSFFGPAMDAILQTLRSRSARDLRVVQQVLDDVRQALQQAHHAPPE